MFFPQPDLENKLYFIYRFFQSLRLFAVKLHLLYPMYLQSSNTQNFCCIWLILISKFNMLLIQIKLQIYLNGLNLPPLSAAADILHAANIYKINIFAGFKKQLLKIKLHLLIRKIYFHYTEHFQRIAVFQETQLQLKDFHVPKLLFCL